jgi:hypothetical protein
MNQAEIVALAASVGFRNPVLASAVAMAESGGDPEAHGDVDLGGSIGLWQVYTVAHPEYDPDQLTDPLYNAKAAFAISQGGKSWTPWTTYRTGAYREYMPGASSWWRWGLGGIGLGSLMLWQRARVGAAWKGARAWLSK